MNNTVECMVSNMWHTTHVNSNFLLNSSIASAKTTICVIIREPIKLCLCSAFIVFLLLFGSITSFLNDTFTSISCYYYN